MTIEEKRLQARDENTASEILAQLATSEDGLTRQYVASNPNTSIKTLTKLGEEFPDEITANPIFDLLLLENPESKFIQLSLARSSTTSVQRLEKLVDSSDRDIRQCDRQKPKHYFKHLRETGNTSKSVRRCYLCYC